jgi:hypothetical protein
VSLLAVGRHLTFPSCYLSGPGYAHFAGAFIRPGNHPNAPKLTQENSSDWLVSGAWLGSTLESPDLNIELYYSKSHRHRRPIPIHYACFELLTKVFEYHREDGVDLDILFSALTQCRLSTGKKEISDLDYFETGSKSPLSNAFQRAKGTEVSEAEFIVSPRI